MPKREKRVIITLSEEEYAIIKQAADAEGRSVSSFFRQSSLNAARWDAPKQEKKEEGK